MSLPRSLLLTIAFALVLAIVVELESQIVSNLDLVENPMIKAYQTVKEMTFKANLDSQMQSWFSKFREYLSQNTDEFFALGKEPEYLLQNLPAHSLTVVKADDDANVLQILNLAGKMDEELIKTFVDLAGEFKIEFSDHTLRPEKRADLVRCDGLMNDYLGAQTARVNMIMLRASRFSIFNFDKRKIWFFWDRFLDSQGNNLFIFSKIDLSQISPDYKFRSFLKNTNDRSIPCAYYRVEQKRFICSNEFKRSLSLDELQRIGSECRNIADELRKTQDNKVVRLPLRNHCAVIGRMSGEIFPLVLVPLTSNDKGNSHLKRLTAFIFFCCMMLLLVNGSVFGRGPKMRVGTVLMMSMFIAIFMPFMLGRTVFKLVLRESYEKERLKLERNLHQSLSGIDNSAKTAQQNLKERIDVILRQPEMQKRIFAEEMNDNDAELDKSFAMEVVNQAFVEIARGYESVPMKYRTLNVFILSGPNDFLRYFNKYRGRVINSRRTIKKFESMYHVLTMFKEKFFEFYDAKFFAPEFFDQFREDGALSKNAIVLEEIRARLRDSLGQEKFHEIVEKKSEVAGLRTSFGKSFIANYVIKHAGKIRYFASVVWDEFAFSPTFLRRAFEYRREADLKEIARPETSIFKRLDPAAFIKRKPIILMAYDGFRYDSFSSEDNEPEILSNLVKNTYRSKLLLRHETAGEKPALFEVYPPSNMTVYLLGAQQDISHLQRIESWRSIIFICGMILFLLFSVAAARNLSSSFTGPLQHLLWGLRMVECNDYSVRLKDTREDEFGSISRAFNLMTRRLKEKDTLGRFVSESVRELAASPSLLKKALEGSEEEVTIVFSNLEGFTRLAMEGNEAEVKAYLEFSLGRYFARTAQYGGEIDKVIGEKILIIFPHRKLGREKAVTAALNLARDIIADFASEKDLKPVFGINMGRVISGIIGAANVRMDLTVIGDPVNVAARLCSIARSDTRPVVISGLINEVAESDFTTEKVDIARVKGKRQEVEVYRLRS